MNKLMIALALVATTACAGRQVEVTTGPQPAADVGIHMTNNLSQAVNVYITTGGTDMLLKQVAANSTEHLPVLGIGAGTNVTLKAVTVDGTRTYTRKDVILSTMYEWRVP
jgi:predicted polyphosphate/ATP-dependent NAD kinase